MKNGGKIIAYWVAIGFILLLAVLSIGLFFMGDSAQELEQRTIMRTQEDVVSKLDDYIKREGRLPQTLSEIGLEQTVSAYLHDDMTFYLIPTEHGYVLECWDENNVEYQYISEDDKWLKEPDLWEFEPPVNADTISNIYRILALKDEASVRMDSARKNTEIYPIINGFNVKPDSIVFMRYCYPDGAIMMQGWITRIRFKESNIDKEFGKWEYYDEKGNCYRKFWNYRNGDELKYEADRQ